MAERALVSKSSEAKLETPISILRKPEHMRSLRSNALQAKLRIGQPDDIYEQEADRVAEKVMRMPDPVLQDRCAKCDEDEKKVLQTKKSSGQASLIQGRDVPPIVQDVLRSPGQSLDSATRAFFEPRFGHDFSSVRVHTDSKALEATQELRANAFTLGRDLVFGAGQYSPETLSGKRLIAHELVHTIQQKTISPITESSKIDKKLSSPVTPKKSETVNILQCDWSSSMKRAWGIYSNLKDEGAPFARELMQWRLFGFGMRFNRFPGAINWNNFMISRPEIQRAMASRFADLATRFAAERPTGNEWFGGWKDFDDSITGVVLNELESMRLTLHGCTRFEIHGRYFVGQEGSDIIVKFEDITFTWVDKGDLHRGTGTELDSDVIVKDDEFMGAGMDYDILIRFKMPRVSTWRVTGGRAIHIKGWPPQTGVPSAGFRG